MTLRSKLASCCLLASTLLGLLPSAMASTVSGQVTDKRTGKPLAGARVTVVGPDASARTDENGSFSLSGIKEGTWALRVEAPGYLSMVVPPVPFQELRPIQLNAALRPGVLKAPTQVVAADRPSRLAQTETSRRSISAEEIKKSAGARNDPLLAVANTAGVHTGGFSGAPAVRGGGPNDNLYHLDGFEIGNPYHFGGLVSVFNANTLSKVDLYSGALPARYGNVMSAVIDVETRLPKSDALHGILDGNLLYSEGLLEGPLAPGLSFSLSGRRSYLDLFVARFLPAFTVFPYFHDYQARLSDALPGGGKLELATFGSRESLSVVLPSGKAGRGIGSLSEEQGYDTTGLIWSQPVGDNVSNRLMLSYQQPYLDVQIGTFLDVLDHTYQSTAADDFGWQLSEAHQLRAGLRYDTIDFVERQTIPVLPPGSSRSNIKPEDIATFPKRTTDTTGNQKVYGAYLEDAWKPLDTLTLSLGARYDRLQSTGEHHLAPRLGLTWRADSDTTWRLGYGQQFQYPTVNQLLPGVGNPKLAAPFSRDYVLGCDRQLTDFLLGKFELYHRDIFWMVVRDPAAVYSNAGSGRSDGAETTLELSSMAGWSGALALTYSQTFRTTPTAGEIPYDYDQPWIANLTLSAPTVLEWAPSLRFRYSSGRPYTPVVDRTLRADGTYAAVNGSTNSRRYPDGITWSARFERPAGWFGHEGKFYFEITQQHEVLAVDYGENYENIQNPNYNYGIPAIPYFGYQLSF